MNISIPLESHLTPFQRILNQGPVYGLGCPVTIVVVGVVYRIRPVRSARKLPSLLPGECIAVVIARGIAYGVISDGAAVVRSQFILPVTVAIGISVRRGGRSGNCCSRLVGINCCTRQVPAQIIAVDDRLVRIQVILADQLI